jgi:hypothetical protein
MLQLTAKLSSFVLCCLGLYASAIPSGSVSFMIWGFDLTLPLTI